MKRTVYGMNPVIEALRSERDAVTEVLVGRGRHGERIRRVVELARRRGAAVRVVAAAELSALTGTHRHQGVAALVRGAYAYAHLEDLIDAWKSSGRAALFLVLDSIEDPQNLGALIRAAECAGAHGVVIPKDRACGVTAAAVKASAGAAEHMPVARVTNLARTMDRLKAEGLWIVALEGTSAESIYDADLSGDLALVVGGEGRGIGRLVMSKCDFAVKIPMAGRVGSLNASQAAAVALFETVRRRRGRDDRTHKGSGRKA
ncbi:MAG TPA: 23S rRNA (guanosine(2251)-2'-O)-methyltransferase RlmB [Deltaproteobacteria bacterium]|nr:23S rRNA (guanosine(2251)-2'-O)-methyltransferase RlmB [Deltaproteobacteria bacterium]